MSSHISQTDQSYTVIGMTCEHCVQAVTEEVGAIPAVTDVRVDLASGVPDGDGDRTGRQGGCRSRCRRGRIHAGRLIGERREKTATMGSGADRPAIAF